MTPVLVDPDEWKSLIRVAVGGKSAATVRSVAFHEAFEAARRLMLTPEEIKLLDAKFPGREGKSASEIQADIFGDYWTEKKGILIPKSARTLFDKIARFLRADKELPGRPGIPDGRGYLRKARPRGDQAAPGHRSRGAEGSRRGLPAGGPEQGSTGDQESPPGNQRADRARIRKSGPTLTPTSPGRR